MACAKAVVGMALLILCLSLLQAQLTHGDHILPPEIVLQPQPVSVQYGQSASLTCSVVGHPDPNILWFKEGCSYSLDSLTTVTGDNGSTSSTLYLNHLAALLQAGNYYCSASSLNEDTNMMDSATSNSVAVGLKEPMVAPYLHVSEVGNTSVTLRWSAFNYSMPIAAYHVTAVNTAGVTTVNSVGGDQNELNIANLVYLDTYQFSLLATDDSGTNYTTPPITVVIRNHMFQLLGECGGQGIIQIDDNSSQWPNLCNVSGSRWDIQAARQICLQLGYRDTVSVVCCAQRDPFLTSACWGRNQSSIPEGCSFTDDSVCNSTTAAIVSCTHTFEPPSNVSVSPTAVIADGQVVPLQCSASQAFPTFYEWQHNGVTVLGLKPDTSILQIPATLATGGEYKCTVSNVGGNSTRDTAYIYVHPCVRSYPNSVSVEEGEALTLNCTAEGYPQPVITWLKDGVQLLVGIETMNQSLTSVQSVLHIDSSVLNDTGEYQCQAASTFDFFNVSAIAISEGSTVVILGTPSKPDPAFLMFSAANSILLGWTEPRDNGAPITQYVITQEASSLVFNVSNGTVLQVNVSGLLPNTNYTFTVVAVNAIGSSNASDPVTFQTQEVPSPPTNLTTVETTPTSLSIEWGPPLQPNGVILWYEVRYTGIDTLNMVPPSFFDESLVLVNGSSFTAELTDLEAYSSYNVSVQAATQFGSSDPVVLAVRTDEGVPSPPANLTSVEATPTSLSVEWGPPLQPNGPGVILWYEVRYTGIDTLNVVPPSFYNESVIRLNASSTAVELVDLEPYSLYNITVQAATRVGIGDPAVLTVRTNETLPSAVVNVTLSVSQRIIDLFWSEPLYPNGELLTYIVSYAGEFTFNTVTDEFNESVISQVNTSDNPMVQLTNLEPYSNYTVTLSAVNSAGEGNITEISVLTLEAVPSPPTNLTTVEITPTSLSVEWGPPLQPNEIILWYEVRYTGIDTLNVVPSSFYNESVIRLNASSTAVELVDLEPYSLYNVTVQAATRVGIGYPAVLTVRTNETFPLAVVNVTLSVSQRTIDLFWSEPLYPNGELLTYMVSYTGEFTFNTVTDDFFEFVILQVNTSDNPMAQLTDLEPYSNYTVTLSAVNSAGEGNITEISVLTLEAVPSPPTNLTTVEITPTLLSIEWGPPLQPNEIILWYEVRYTGIDTLNVVPPSFYNESVIRLNASSNTAELEDLEPYSLYNISVQAATRVGISDPAVLTVRTNETLPSAVVNVTLSVSPRTIDLFWSEPLYPNGELMTYIVSFAGEFTFNTVTDEFFEFVILQVNTSDNPMAQLTDLEPYSNYTITLSALNSAGEGNITEISVLTLEAAPSAPENLNITDITPTMFFISWDPPTHPNGVLLSYEVTYTGEDTLNDVPESFFNTTTISITPNLTSVELFGLEPFSIYNITLRAVNGAGNGDFSSDMGLLTRTDPFLAEPSANLSEYDITINSFSVEWIEPLDPNGVIVSYYVELTAVDGSFLQAMNVSNTTFNATFYGLEPVIRYNVSVCAWTIDCGENLTITVLTDGIPPNVTRADDLFLVAELNQPLNLSFVVLDAAPNISEGVVWWVFTSSRGVMNLTCDNSTEYTFSGDCLSVRINRVEHSDGGQYEIVAETRAGIGRSLVFVIVRDAPPSIYTPLPSELSQVHLTNFTLTCSAVADLTAVIVWRYDNERVEPEFVTTNRTHSILRITSLTSSNSGTYNCSASNRYGRDSTETILTVQAPPTINNFPSQGRDVVVGDPLVITCTAEGTPLPYVVWFKGNISQDNVTEGANTSTARLNIEDFQTEDEGYYSCIATNSIGSVNRTLLVTIVERPNITGITLSNATSEGSVVNGGSAGPVDEFKEMTLFCSATGKPTPNILWLRDGVLLSNNSRRTIIGGSDTSSSGRMLGTSTLTISEVMLADSGMYTCRAVSGNVSPIPGQTAWTFQLDVQPRNECIAWTPCNVAGTVQCIDGSGDYTCVCKTMVVFAYIGKNCSMIKDLRTPPVVISHPEDQPNVAVSSMVSLFCNVTGIPAPTVRWFKDGQDINADEGTSFTLGSIKPEDRGVYHCVATNERGTAESQGAVVLIQGLIQFQVNLVTSPQSQMQLSMEEVQDVAQQLQLLAVGSEFTASDITGRLHTLEMYNRKNSTLLVTMVARDSLPYTSNFSAQFQMYLEQALQGYSDILKGTPFAVNFVQRHDGCPMDVSPVMTCSSIDQVSWSEAEINDTVEEQCPCGIEDALINELMGSRTCGGSYTSGAEWMDPQCNECNFTESRNDLCRLTQVDSPAQLALRLTNATNNTAQLMREDISASTFLLETVATQNTTDDFSADYVQMDMLTTMDNIAGVSAEQLARSQEGTRSSMRVLTLVEEITKRANVSLNSSFEFTGTQLSLTVTEMSTNLTDNGTDLSSIIADQIERITNSSMTSSQSDMNELPPVSVILPESIIPLRNDSTNVSRLAVAVFATDSLFQQRESYTYSLYEEFAQVTGTIVDVSVVGEVIDSGDLPEGEVVTLVFDKNQIGVERGLNGKCAFWKFDDDDRYGGWNASGCNVSLETNTTIHCQCDHLTHFCILMDIFPERSPGVPGIPELQEALSYISIIGAIVSSICFVLVSITYLSIKKLRSDAHNQILVNLCLSLTGLYITFIISTIEGVIQTPPLCGTVGALLHYFFLSTFLLMVADVLHIFKKFAFPMKSDIAGYVAICGAISWVLPIFIVAFSLAPNYQHYYTDHFCRAYGMPYYIGVLVPFGLVYVFNWVMFIAIMVALGNRTTINKSHYQKWRENFWVAVVLSLLFGLAWSLGLLASNGIPRTFAAIFECAFTVLLTAQGVLLFIIYCVKSKDARDFWKGLFLSVYHCRDKSKRARGVSSSTKTSNLGNTLSKKGYGSMTAASPSSTLPMRSNTARSVTEASALSLHKPSPLSNPYVSNASELVIDNSFAVMLDSVYEDKVTSL